MENFTAVQDLTKVQDLTEVQNSDTSVMASQDVAVPKCAAPADVRAANALAHRELLDAHIQQYAMQRAVSTGFTQLDNLLSGGLYPGLYTIGAMTSLGKTALVLQMVDQIAQAGHDVLYVSLEMGMSELMARSISRLTYLDAMEAELGDIAARTMWGVLDGSRYETYTPDELELIKSAREKYDKYSGYIHFCEGVGDMGVASIRDKAEKQIAALHTTPVVVIDYLQLLAPYSDRMTDKQNVDKNVIELKRMSRDLHIPLIVISSYNRGGYDSKANLASNKESGLIEYTSDVVMGLQLQGMEQAGFDSDAAKAAIPRYVEAVVLKNRNGAVGKAIRFEYQPKFHSFREMGADEHPILPGSQAFMNGSGVAPSMSMSVKKR